MAQYDSQNPKPLDRRAFIKRTGVAAAAAVGAAQTAQADIVKHILPRTIMGANEKIYTGHIGLGGMGKNDLRIGLLRDDVVPIHMCDVYETHREQGADIVEGRHARPATTAYFEEIIENKDVDAVIIATPDHWHAIPSIMSCEAGKAVYCEKPMATTVAEGLAMVDAVKRTKAVFQLGTMQRSGEHFQQAVKLIQDGHIGKVGRVETWAHDFKKVDEYAGVEDGPAPEGLDWDRYIGWTPKVPFNKNRFLNSFRWFLDYSSGKITDWGAHLIDIAVWGMGQDKPARRVSATGGKLVMQDTTTTPDTLDVIWEFDDYQLSFSNRMWNPMPLGRGIQYGIMWHGTLGTLLIDRTGFRVYSFKHNGGCEEIQVKDQKEMALNVGHWANFAHCIRTGEKPICDVETGFNSTKICQIGLAAYIGGAQLDWDDDNNTFTGPDSDAAKKANDFAYREYQNGWSLKSPYMKA